MADIEEYKYLKNIEKIQRVQRAQLICFLFLILIHILDIISTIIGLNLGAYETNTVSAYFFNFGIPGFILNTVRYMCIILLIFIILENILILYENLSYKEASLTLIVGVYFIISLSLFIGVLLAVLNNISVILSLI